MKDMAIPTFFDDILDAKGIRLKVDANHSVRLAAMKAGLHEDFKMS